jgi:flavin-dependent thymidylate synthase
MTRLKSSPKAMDNEVVLMGTYGGDESHALSAWTSTSRDLTEEKRGRMGKLLQTLASEGHHSPFEKSSLHFLVTTDIATHIHIIKHRVAVSVNAESARYKELLDDKYYIPADWHAEEVATYVAHLKRSFDLYHSTIESLVKKGFSRKRAKESARFFLPYGNQITSDVMFNFRSFMHFTGLRYSSHAQLEVRNVASKMLKLVKDTGQFDASLKAFGYLNDDGSIRDAS